MAISDGDSLATLAPSDGFLSTSSLVSATDTSGLAASISSDFFAAGASLT